MITTIDIGTYAIKILSGKGGKRTHISKSVESFNTSGSDNPQNETQRKQLSELLGDLINQNKIPKGSVRLSLPEHLASTQIISIPSLTTSELASAIDWQAEQHIPIPKNELNLEYQVLKLYLFYNNLLKGHGLDIVRCKLRYKKCFFVMEYPF